MTTIESLRNLQDRLHEPLSVHERVRLLNRIAEELYEREPARGVTMARESVGLARATADTPGEAQALYCLGRNLFSIADYPAVFETQNDALALFRGMNDSEGEAKCLNLLRFCGDEWNKTAPPDQRVIEMEIQQRQWDFIADGDDPTRFRVADRATVGFGEQSSR